MKFAAGLAVLAGANAVAVTPIQKVVQLLSDMEAKGKQAKHEEEVEFSACSQFCESTRQATAKSIEQGKEQIVQLEADITKASADAERLAAEVADHDAKATQAKADLDQATVVRKQENSDYAATEADLSESIDAIERAIAVLNSKKADVPQSLLQVSNMKGLPEEAKATIESFMEMSSDDGVYAPAANAYEFQSGSVVGMLEKLRLKFQDEKLAAQKAEMNNKANFELVSQSLQDDIQEDSKQSQEKTAVRANRVEAVASAQGDLASTQKTKAEDEQRLTDTIASCNSRSVEFEKNQAVRSEEIKAIGQAMEILQSDAVSGNAAKHLPTLVQVSAQSLVQLRGGEAPAEDYRRSLLQAFLKGRAGQLGSRYLALVAASTAHDPLAKVKQMIKDLVVKLMEEANAEADKKAYCDKELSTNKQTREDKQAEVEELTASVDKHAAESAQLADEVASLVEALAQLRQEMKDATALRQTEKATNTQTIADAKEAQGAVGQATDVLRNFYQKAGGASFTQEPYTGMQSEHGGIVGFLEVILSDFARLETETTTAEDEAERSYTQFMEESEQDISVKDKERAHKALNQRRIENDMANLRRELSLTQEELDAAVVYYDKLKPDCVDNGLSYEDRVRMRQEEIQSLKEALTILSQEETA